MVSVEYFGAGKDPAPVCYKLPGEELTRLTQELVATDPYRDEASRYVCYRVEGDSPYANIGRHIERQVFETAFGNDENKMQEEYGSYDPASTFFITVDTETGTPTGVLRAIRNSEAGLKTLNDMEDAAKTSRMVKHDDVISYHGIDDLDKCWDVGTVAVVPEYRHAKAAAGISIQLYRALYVSAKQEGIEHMISVIDKKAVSQLKGYLGVPFEQLGGSKAFEYLGSKESSAVYGFIPEFFDKMNSWRQYLPKRLLARGAFHQLVHGSNDDALHFNHNVQPY